MARVTREQIEKLNGGCGNGFKVDLNRLVMRGEKIFVLDVPVSDTEKLEITVDYIDTRDGLVPRISVDLWTKCDYSSDYYSHHSGDYSRCVYVVDAIQKRKNVKPLQKITVDMSSDFLQSLIDDYHACEEKRMELDIFTERDVIRERSYRITMQELATVFA